MRCMPLTSVLTVTAGIMAAVASSAQSAKPLRASHIEAIEGKRYTLSKDEGPWMIMVASLRAASPDGTVRNGKTPEQLADELVFELRKKGLPAYFYSLESGGDLVKSTDRTGREEMRKFLSHQDQVCVLAGNYASVDDTGAQKTLEIIKSYQPQCMQEGRVSWLKTRRRQGPLGGAFLSINPLLSPEELAQRKDDPLLRRLNSGVQHSLLENQSQYTLVVATFAGKSYAHLGDGNSSEAQSVFQVDDDLDKAAVNAWELAVALRERENVEAYVWHGRYESIVTVGGFNSDQDPRIRQYARIFGATPPRPQADGAIEQVSYIPDSNRHLGMVAGDSGVKFFAIDDVGKKASENRMWLFDPSPRLMRVPRLQ